MPTFPAEDRLTPKSALRYRPIPIHADDQPVVQPFLPHASRRATTAPPGAHKSKPIIPPIQKGIAPSALQRKRAARQPSHWLVHVGMTMTAMIVVLFVIQGVSGWVTTLLDDVRYGSPRITQLDAVVGHQDSAAHPSHFLAIDFHGQAQVIEYPGGNASQARVYLGPKLAGANADQVPVLLSFVDRRGTHVPDMVVQIAGVEVVFLNEHSSFVPQG